MRLLVLCAFLFFLSIIFRIEDHKPSQPKAMIQVLDSQNGYVSLASFANQDDLIFFQTLPQNPFGPLFSLGLSILSDLGRGYDLPRLLLFQSNSIQDWERLFSHSAFSAWEVGGKVEFFWVSLYQAQSALLESLPKDLRLEVDKKMDWVPWQALSEQSLYLRRYGAYLLVSSSPDRKLPPLQSQMTSPIDLNPVFRIKEGGIKLISKLVPLKDPSLLNWIEGLNGTVVSESRFKIEIRVKNSPNRLDLLRQGQVRFDRFDTMFHLGVQLSNWFQSESVKKRISTRFLRNNKLLSGVLETLEGRFTLVGDFTGKTPAWALRLGCSSPGTSGQAVSYLEQFLHSKGGILASLSPGKTYSLSLPFLPVNLFLSRDGKNLVLGNQPDSWPDKSTRSGLPGLAYMEINLRPIWSQVEKFTTQAKRRYHMTRFRECIQRLKASSMRLDSCPFGPPYLQSGGVQSCIFHGSLANPGVDKAIAKEPRFSILRQAIKVLDKAFFELSVGEDAIQLEVTRSP
jgi:hypothetical protein